MGGLKYLKLSAGDLVKVYSWVKGGAIGIVLSVQEVKLRGIGAYVLMNGSVELIHFENLKVIDESR
jgi:hypothetical protein